MLFRKDPTSRVRARADDDKAKVRQAFVNVGRRLFATEDPSKVSLRRIAAEAGYSPGSIYSYFADYRALQTAIRETDTEAAVIHFEQLAARTHDPVERMRKLFLDTVVYWLQHTDQFDVLFSPPSKLQPTPAEGGQLFGQSAQITTRALNVYYSTTKAFFDSLPRHPIDHHLAADAMMAAVHGIVAFPRMTRAMEWSYIPGMAKVIIDGMLDHWTEQASRK